MAQPVTPSMLEFMDAACVRLAREVGGVDLPEAGALLMIEADGDAAVLPAALRRAGGRGAWRRLPGRRGRSRRTRQRKALGGAQGAVALAAHHRAGQDQ